MSEYIKREDALNTLKPIVGIWDEDGVFRVDYVRVLSIIKNIPSADVVERKRGKWIYTPRIYTLKFEGSEAKYEERAWACSECGYIENLDIPPNFCSHCGADMREREGE